VFITPSGICYHFILVMIKWTLILLLTHTSGEAHCGYVDIILSLEILRKTVWSTFLFFLLSPSKIGLGKLSVR